jgi:hypothetical protein
MVVAGSGVRARSPNVADRSPGYRAGRSDRQDVAEAHDAHERVPRARGCGSRRASSPRRRRHRLRSTNHGPASSSDTGEDVRSDRTPPLGGRLAREDAEEHPPRVTTADPTRLWAKPRGDWRPPSRFAVKTSRVMMSFSVAMASSIRPRRRRVVLRVGERRRRVRRSSLSRRHGAYHSSRATAARTPGATPRRTCRRPRRGRAR